MERGCPSQTITFKIETKDPGYVRNTTWIGYRCWIWGIKLRVGLLLTTLSLSTCSHSHFSLSTTSRPDRHRHGESTTHPHELGREKRTLSALLCQCNAAIAGRAIALNPTSPVEHVRHVIAGWCAGPGRPCTCDWAEHVDTHTELQQGSVRQQQWECRLKPSPPETVRIHSF